jgi:hypothetical protein
LETTGTKKSKSFVPGVFFVMFEIKKLKNYDECVKGKMYYTSYDFKGKMSQYVFECTGVGDTHINLKYRGRNKTEVRASFLPLRKNLVLYEVTPENNPECFL